MASALEQFVNTVRSFSSQGNVAQLCEYLGKSTELLTKNAVHLDNVLATLDLQQHSLGVLAVLCAKFSAPNTSDYEPIYAQFQEFITTCNGEQVRFATNNYAELCHLYTNSLLVKKQPIRGINLIARAIRKIQLFDSQLTSIHADLCQLCLLSGVPKPALEFLDVDITDISKENGHYNPKHFLLYYYYGGMIYASLKQYLRALHFFEVCITTPAQAVSHIMVEAYKKYILVSLILHGKIIELPKYTSHVISRFFRHLCQPYHSLAVAYVSNNPDNLRQQISTHQETFTNDNNLGLVKQCLGSLFRKNIQRLTKTFMTLSLSDMAHRVQLGSVKDAETYVLHMIEDGEIFASINQKDGMVVFRDNPEEYNTLHMLSTLDQDIASCMTLEKHFQKMDEDITTNPQYVQKASGMTEEDAPASSVGGRVSTYMPNV